MTRWLASLSSRIFLASAVLAVASILAAVWLVNRSVTRQTEREVARGLSEAATLVDEYRGLSLAQLEQSAQLVADLPKFKAAVETDDPPTVAPLAADYRTRLGADVLVVTGREGRLLASAGQANAEAGSSAASAPVDTVKAAGTTGGRKVAFVPGDRQILQLVTVPVWIDPADPALLGTLSVGVALDSSFAAHIKRLTDSDIVFAWDGRVRAGTLPGGADAVTRWLQDGARGPIVLGGEEYGAIVRPLATIAAGAGPAASDAGSVIVLRSRTERLRPLRALHRALGATALAAVLAAILLSYLTAQTVSRPIRAITATMRDMAVSGDPSAGAALPPSPAWGDEDARVLATTFNAMTASLARFQREAAQRERLSSLGRLSTVIAHEIRNPLMIVKAALRTLRRAPIDPLAQTALADIDSQVERLNRLVHEVLDFARPIRFTLAPASLSALCRDALAASEADAAGTPCAVALDPAADEVITDADRLQQALINVLTNARQAVALRDAAEVPASGTSSPPGIELRTAALDGDRVCVVVRDSGPGLDGAIAGRVFDPFFTTKASGTGIGLAITRNIVEGLGGTIRLHSEPGNGTEVLIDLPRTPPVPGGSPA